MNITENNNDKSVIIKKVEEAISDVIIRKLHYANDVEKAQLQAKAAAAIALGIDVLINFTVGGGKTLTSLLGSTVKKDANVLIVVPLTAIKGGFIALARKLGINITRRSRGFVNISKPRCLIVCPETVYNWYINKAQGTLEDDDILEENFWTNIILDEYHLAVTWGLDPNFRELGYRSTNSIVANSKAQITILSATTTQSRLHKICNLIKKNKILRIHGNSKSLLRHLDVGVIYSGFAKDDPKRVKIMVDIRHQVIDNKVLYFVNSRQKTKNLVEYFDGFADMVDVFNEPAYKGISPRELNLIYEQKNGLIVATEYLGAGYDDTLQFIYIFGFYGITTLVQMIGRGGRGDAGCKVKLLLNMSMFNNSMKNTFSIPTTAKTNQEELIITLQLIINPLYICFHVLIEKYYFSDENDSIKCCNECAWCKKRMKLGDTSTITINGGKIREAVEKIHDDGISKISDVIHALNKLLDLKNAHFARYIFYYKLLFLHNICTIHLNETKYEWKIKVKHLRLATDEMLEFKYYKRKSMSMYEDDMNIMMTT